VTTPVPGTVTTPVPGSVTTPTPGPATAGKEAGWEVVKPPWHKNKRTRRWAIAGGILFVLLVIGLIPYPLYVTEPCMVSPIDRAEVRSQISGIIAEVFVREGDAVEIGTQLARLDDRDLTYSLRQAQAEADRYTANLAKVKGGSRPEEIRRAQALVSAKAQDVKFAEIEAKRQQKLFNQGVASAMARDEARRDLGVKRGALSEAQAELRLVQAGSRTEEVDVAEAELRKVEAEIDFLKKQMDNLIVRSPIEGRVLTPRFHERLHARLNPGDTVCEIGNGETVRVDIFVPESDADIVRVGHPVAVKVKSYPLESFDGRVSHIAPAVEDVEGQRVIRVETVLENDKGLLRPRMSGFAEIDTGKRPIAVRVFRRAVRWLRVRFLL
jgi:HlyD family secretion protein